MITEGEFDIALERFANSISKQQLGLVYYRPDTDSEPTDCITNVKNFVNKNGGSAKYGWTFNHRISLKYGDYLFATHHAVWINLDGNLIDITPFHHEDKHHPLTIQGNVMFLLDDSANPIEKNNFIIPRPLKYFAISKGKEMEQYLESLREREINHYKESYGIDEQEIF